MKTTIRHLLSFFLLPSSFFLVAASGTDDTLPLKSATPDGVGPLNIASLTWRVVGTSTLGKNTPQPDIFIDARGNPTALYHFPWVRTTDDGTPVFAQPTRITAPPTSSTDPKPTAGTYTIFQTRDGVTHALSATNRKITHTTLNPKTLEFENPSDLNVPNLPTAISCLTAIENPDSSIELVFEVKGFSIPSADSSSRPNNPDWRPFDAAGINTRGTSYAFLYAAHIPALLKDPVTNIRQFSPTNAEVPRLMRQITSVTLDPKHPRSIITGSHEGVFNYYPNTSDSSLATNQQLQIAGPDGNVQHHPQINGEACAYPDIKTGNPSHILSSGEGPLYIYKFTGNFAPNGNPIYQQPTHVLQTDADLHTGTLPSLAVIDWDGDGVLDIIAANSEGLVLFLKNVGTNQDPAFLPGTRVKTKNGHDIHHQAEYKGSVQSLGEARWGYLSATPIDWNGDGLPDLITCDISGNYHLYLNTGTPTNPQLESRQPLFLDGIPFHGSWRCQPAIARDGNRVLLATIDDQHQFHLYQRIDNQNIADLGKIPLTDGTPINVTRVQIGGGTGRTKLSFCDANNDGNLDIAIGTCGSGSIPDNKTGLPRPGLGESTPGTCLLMLNAGTNQKFALQFPMPFFHKTTGLLQTPGWHERSAVLSPLGASAPGQLSLLTANEHGQLFLFRSENISARPVNQAAAINTKTPLIDSDVGKNIPVVNLQKPIGENFTISLFFKVTDAHLLSTGEKWDQTHPMTLANFGSSDKTQSLIIRLNKNKVLLAATADTGKNWPSITLPFNINPDTTYHLAVVRENRLTKLYLNGFLVSTSSTLPVTPKLNAFSYARSGSGRYLIGAISKPTLFPSLLTPEQIRLLSTQ